jgi:transcriptional regulator EpsA
MVVLSPQEQEYLLHALDTAQCLREQHQFYLWSQGALQALLPHRVLLCLRLDGEGRVQRVECLHSIFLDMEARRQLCDPLDGPAPGLLCAWRQGGEQPLAVEVPGFGHALVHGSGALTAGASCFVLLGLPYPAAMRQCWLLQLLLPSLHLALQRSVSAGALSRATELKPAVSPRQAQILCGLREGKSNEEIGQLLGISSLTVKNHLQRLYRQLGVSNRAHAVALCTTHKFD